MKKALVALLLTVGLSFAVTLPAAATPVGNEQPACGDLFGFTDEIVYHSDVTSPQNTVEATIHVNDVATCKDVTYTMYVTYVSGGKTRVRSLTLHGDGVNPFVSFLLANVFPDSGSVPCVYFESAKGNSIIDRAPDSGCITAVVDPTSSGGGGTPFT
jgi:hypothetical protein